MRRNRGSAPTPGRRAAGRRPAARRRGRPAGAAHPRPLPRPRLAAARADPGADHRRLDLEHARPDVLVGPDVLHRRRAEPAYRAVLGELDYEVAAFTHGPEIREDAREAVRGFLPRPSSVRLPGEPRHESARRIAMAAAYGGGGLGVAERRGVRPDPGRGCARPPRHRRADRGRRRTPTASTAPTTPASRLRSLMLGDSSACGLGVDHPHQTPGAMLAAGLAECADRPVALPASAVVGARSSDLTAQIDAGRRLHARHRGHHDRRERRDPPGQAADGRPPPRPRGAPAARGRAPRWSSAPARTSAPSSRSRSRCAGSPGGPAGSSPPRRRSRSSRPAGAPSRSATSSARSSPPRRRRCSARTASTPRWPATPALPPRCCPRCAPRWASGSAAQAEEAPDLGRGEGVRPISLAAVEAADEAGTEVAAAQVGGRDRGPRGRWALLRRRPGSRRRDAGTGRPRDGGRAAALAWTWLPQPRPYSAGRWRARDDRGGPRARGSHRRNRAQPDRPRVQGVAGRTYGPTTWRRRSCGPRSTSCPGSTRQTLDDLMLGCAEPEGKQGVNMARRVAVALGYDSLPGTTVNRFCASSVQTSRMAFHAIKAGEGRRVRVGRGRVRVAATRRSAVPAAAARSSSTRLFDEARARTVATAAIERDLARPPAATAGCPTSTSRWARPPRTSPPRGASAGASRTSSASGRRTSPRRPSPTASSTARSSR